MMRVTFSPIRRLARSVSGAVAVELALLSPFVLVLIVGAWDMGRYLNDSAALTNLSRTGVQYALSKFWDPTLVKAAVEAEATRQTVSGVTVTVTATCMCTDGTTMVVKETCTAATVCTGGSALRVYSDVNAKRQYTASVPIPIPGMDANGAFNISKSTLVRVR